MLALVRRSSLPLTDAGPSYLKALRSTTRLGLIVVLVGEIDLLCRSSVTDMELMMTSYFARHQASDHAVPDLLHKHAFALDLFAQRLSDIHVKTGGFAIGCLEGEGFVGGVDGDLGSPCLGAKERRTGRPG